MITTKNRLILGIIMGIIKGVLKAVYAILCLFNLHWTLLLAIIGVVLYFTEVLTNVMTVRVIFFILLIVSVFYAIIATIFRILGIGNKKHNSSVQIIKNNKKPLKKQDVAVAEEQLEIEPESIEQLNGLQTSVNEDVSVDVAVKDKLIGYYKVKQNPNYIMAEYENRYELYGKVNGVLKKIRTDYKY